MFMGGKENKSHLIAAFIGLVLPLERFLDVGRGDGTPCGFVSMG